VQKLGIREGARVLLVSAPPGFGAVLGKLPDGTSVQSRLGGGSPFNVIVAFFTRRAVLEERLPVLQSRMVPNAGLWIAWPKKASGVETDLSENPIRALALASGLVDNKVCAIDETWSGLRLVLRLKDRPVLGGRT